MAGEVSVQRGASDAELGGDLAHRQLALLEHRERGGQRALGDRRRTATGPAARPCGFKPGAGAFLDDSALELGERAEQLQLEASHRARGVDRLGQRPHRDPAAVELEHELDQVAEAASEPVELPYDEGVAGAQAVQALVELWGGVLERPGADLLEDPLDAGAARA